MWFNHTSLRSTCIFAKEYNFLKMSNTATKNSPAPILDREQIQTQIKPLSNNGFKAFLQKIGRWWLTGWYGFCDKNPGLGKLLHMVFFFLVFSMMVTAIQMVLFMFLPAAFANLSAGGLYFNEIGWLLPGNVVFGYALVDIPVYAMVGETAIRVGYIQDYVAQHFAILGSPVRYEYLASGNGVERVMHTDGGLAYFVAVAIAIFVAQVINFPLQRNITFKSKGNPAYQAMWYLIGWILIQPVVFTIGNSWRALVALVLGATWPPFIVLVLDLLITGGVSMIIFFFIFKIIFPDRNAVAKKAKGRYESVKAKGITGDKLAKLEAKARDTEIRARHSNAEKNAAKTANQASSKAIAFNAAETAYEKATAKLEAAKVGNASGAALANVQLAYAEAKARVPAKQIAVSEAAREKYLAAVELTEATSEFTSYKQELGLAK